MTDSVGFAGRFKTAGRNRRGDDVPKSAARGGVSWADLQRTICVFRQPKYLRFVGRLNSTRNSNAFALTQMMQ